MLCVCMLITAHGCSSDCFITLCVYFVVFKERGFEICGGKFVMKLYA